MILCISICFTRVLIKYILVFPLSYHDWQKVSTLASIYGSDSALPYVIISNQANYDDLLLSPCNQIDTGHQEATFAWQRCTVICYRQFPYRIISKSRTSHMSKQNSLLGIFIWTWCFQAYHDTEFITWGSESRLFIVQYTRLSFQKPQIMIWIFTYVWNVGTLAWYTTLLFINIELMTTFYISLTRLSSDYYNLVFW